MLDKLIHYVLHQRLLVIIATIIMSCTSGCW
jgi:hypothetical protein